MVAKSLALMATRKTFLSEVCAVAIGNLVEVCQHREWEEEVVREVVRGGVGEGWSECDSTRLYLLLRMPPVLP